MRGRALLALVLCFGPVSARAQGTTPQIDSLMATGQRITAAWSRHDFEALTREGAGEILLVLPGGAAPSPLKQRQAAELLRGFTDGAVEAAAQLRVARAVDRDRAYIEMERVFSVRGTPGRKAQTVLFGLRRTGSGYRIYEVRILQHGS